MGHRIDSPRDAASGLATGKRNHKPIQVRGTPKAPDGVIFGGPAPAPAKAAPPRDAMTGAAAKKKLSITGRRPPVTIADPSKIDPALAALVKAGVQGAAAGHAQAAATAPVVRNTGTAPLQSATGSITKDDWKTPERLVAKMTQNSKTPDSVSSDARCGPTNLLAVAMLNDGQEGAAQLLERSLAKMGGRLELEDAKELKRIASAVRKGTATFEDLSRAQGLLYTASNTRAWLGDALTDARSSELLDGRQLARLAALEAKSPNLNPAELRALSELLTTGLDRPVTVTKETVKGFESRGPQLAVNFNDAFLPESRSGLDDAELARAAGAGGLSSKQVSAQAAGSLASTALEKLAPGQAAVLRVALDSSSTAPDHFVTVGKLRDGRAFIYNPDPTRGDATLVIGSAVAPQPATFTRELARYDQRSIAQPGSPSVVPPMTVLGAASPRDPQSGMASGKRL